MHPDDTVLTAEPHLQTLAPNTTNVPTQHLTPTLSQPENEDLKEKQLKGIATIGTVVPVQVPEQKLSNVLVYNIATLLELSKGPIVTPAEMEHCDNDTKGKILSISDSSDVSLLLDVPTSRACRSKQSEISTQCFNSVCISSCNAWNSSL